MTDYSQPGIFNALDYGMRPDYDGLTNAAALQSAIDAAQTSGNPNGAIVLIPSFYDDGEGTIKYGSYAIEQSAPGFPAITIPASIAGVEGTPLLIMRTGPGTTLVMQTAGATLFSVDSPFTVFQDLTVVDASMSETSAGTAFDFVSGGGSAGYKLFRLNIVDFPKAVVVENQVLAVNLLQCSISYDAGYSGADCVAITTSGAQTNVEACSLVFAMSGVNAYTGIKIVASSYARVTDTQISGFGTGILLGAGGSGTARRGGFKGLDVDATDTCVKINGATYDVGFVSCSFTPTNSPSPGAAVIVGMSGGNNGDYDTIRFTGCTAEGFATYGIQINCGQNLQINGGSYSGNGTAGIAIVGAATEVQITGANCIGAAPGATQQYGIYIAVGQDLQIVGANCSGNAFAGIAIDGATAAAVLGVRVVGAICENGVLGGASQQYGVHVAGGSGVLIDGSALTNNALYGVYLGNVENVTVSACDVYSSATGAKGVFVGPPAETMASDIFIRGCDGALFASYPTFLTVTGAVTNLQVTDCAGYNDLGDTILANGASAPSGGFNGVTYGYYGPTAFYLVATGSTVTIDGHNTHLSSGGFTLALGETAQISGGTVTHFLMVGK